MRGLPALHLGWQLRDPGPPPRSRLLDDVPWSKEPGELAAQHDQWRTDVEADSRRLARIHAGSDVWFPIVRPSRRPVIPLYGGSSATWAAAVATLTSSLVAAGCERIRLLNLGQRDVLDRFSRARLRWSARQYVLSSSGSDFDVFKAATADELASLVADVLRPTSDHQGRLEAGRDKQRFLEVAGLLGAPQSLRRLLDAVTFVLTGHPDPSASFTADEETALLDYHVRHVRQRRQLADGLDRMQQDLRMLLPYGPDPRRGGRAFGSGPLRLTAFSVEPSGAISDFEIGREILSRFVARQVGRTAATAPHPQALIVVGADHLAPEVLASLSDSAQRHAVQLLLFFERLLGPGEHLLGIGGSPYAVFFNLSNPDDSEKAAAFVGREFTFVVNGYSIAEGTASEWSVGHQVGTDQATTRSWNYGQGFGSSVARGLSRSTSSSSSAGGSRSSTTTVSHGRVHEYVLEPEEFKRLPEGAMLVVEEDEVTLGFCDPAIRALPVTVPFP